MSSSFYKYKQDLYRSTITNLELTFSLEKMYWGISSSKLVFKKGSWHTHHDLFQSYSSLNCSQYPTVGTIQASFPIFISLLWVLEDWIFHFHGNNLILLFLGQVLNDLAKWFLFLGWLKEILPKFTSPFNLIRPEGNSSLHMHPVQSCSRMQDIE